MRASQVIYAALTNLDPDPFCVMVRFVTFGVLDEPRHRTVPALLTAKRTNNFDSWLSWLPELLVFETR
jgi:hypothetical protein